MFSLASKLLVNTPMANANARDAAGLVPAKPVRLVDEVSYQPGSVVSRTVAKAKGGTLTLFAFDAGEALTEHTSPFDAFVTVLDGSVELTIAGERVVATAGETVLMPGGSPHALKAMERFKMLLSMVRGAD